MYLLGDSMVKFVRSFLYLLAVTVDVAVTINLTNSLGVRLGVTVDVAVAIVMTAGMVFLIKIRELLPPRLGHLLLEFLLKHSPLCLGQILHCHGDRVLRPDFGPGTTLPRVCHGFDKLA
jgi:hypothetical protein